MTSNNGKNLSTEVKNKANLLKNKVKTSFKNRKQYQIFQSKQFLGIVWAICAETEMLPLFIVIILLLSQERHLSMPYTIPL